MLISKQILVYHNRNLFLLGHFCQFPVILCSLIGKLSLFFVSGGTEHQSCSMEQDSMTKELIFGKKQEIFIP